MRVLRGGGRAEASYALQVDLRMTDGARPTPDGAAGETPARQTGPARRLAVLRRYARMLNAARYAELLRARWMLLAALGTIGVGVFLKLTSELSEGELDGFDQAVLKIVVSLRVPALNGPAVDLTALGSVTVLTLIVTSVVLFLWFERDLAGIAQLLLASLGGALGSTLLKSVMERARPPEISRLVHVSSSSYPSGHSLASASIYLTIALVLSRRLPAMSQRVLLFTLLTLLALTIGSTRAYLGVHYPSDIAAGFSLGAGWALLVSAAFSYARAAKRPRLPAT